MSQLNHSLLRGLSIMECLFEDSFEGKTLDEIFEATDIPSSTAWRMLQTLEAKGWVVELPVGGSKQGRWRVSAKLTSISASYERHALEQVQTIKREFRGVVGKDLTL
ncbi:helix-turn-helix domain-containing protein [Zhongshania sp.]|uniref:helix-turn-helix domain-containing protein n=1 Tax=Zhongshania sp. TaxID=1971902 RepID=UPI001B650782|nr:helix-turn-helix domain-containing protein [Zhongshania sp.]MBQ0796246.1 helix-turn-helix domain-containing protein [Zhongshania sp.]